MQKLEFKCPTRIHYGAGAIGRLGVLLRELGVRRALVVSDRGLLDAGHLELASKILRHSGVEFAGFHEFDENPTSSMAERGRICARENNVDGIVGLGGGSSLDCAKAVNFLLTNGGRMSDYWGYGKARKEMLPMVAVPTTAGTGSEVQSFALITEDESHRKMACGDPKAAFRHALLDPALTLSMPREVTAATGLDAIGHAVETYVTRERNMFSQFFSLEAWKLLEKNFVRVLDQPDDLSARGSMLLGSCFAGVAIENSMLGATHALANPLTEDYGTTHGVAIAILLPRIVDWNSEAVGSLYEEMMKAVGQEGVSLAEHLEMLLMRSGMPARLRDLHIPERDLPALARAALQQWTGRFNPRELTEADALSLYRSAY